MDLTNRNNLLIFGGICLIILEILLGASTGFDLFITGIIFIISGGVGLMTHSFEPALISIVALSLIYFVVGRKIIKKKLSVETKQTNVDAIIGKTAMVIKKISPNHAGQVKVGGEIWRADCDKTIDEGEPVVVESVSGVTLKVNKK